MCSDFISDKTPHTNKEEVFINIKSMHVTYYRSFDSLMGLWIINAFLKPLVTGVSTAAMLEANNKE